ncbi:MgtC/SapB family protein [Sphingosinicellaceae bacterium]|nr:MgtC/SapB family protein [Sphingosinicellaceae bacterium]
MLRLTAATLIGCLIGLNRDLHGKPTGIRTLGLVGLSSALIVLVAYGRGDSGDASRAIQGVVTGIGFLGAGVIIKDPVNTHIRGLTTAASIYLTAGLGVACALGAWVPMAIAGVLAAVVLGAGGQLEKALRRRWAHPTDADPPP